MHVIQENKDILGDGYEGDVLGESTPDVIVNEFVCFFSIYFFTFSYSYALAHTHTHTQIYMYAL